MRRSVRTWIRHSAGLLAVLVGLTLAAPPAGADQMVQSPVAPKTLKAATAAKLAGLNTDKAIIASQDAGGGSSSSSGFFKTRKGVATLVLMLGGVAWAIASRKQDAVHSPAR